MRYWLMPLALLLLVGTMPNAQDLKKDKDKDMDKEFKEITIFAGKTFNQWKKELHHIDPAEREVAMRSITNFPLDRVYTALPDILKELERDKGAERVDLAVCVYGVIAVGKILHAKNLPSPEMVKAFEDAKGKPDPKLMQELYDRHKPDPKLVQRSVALFKYFMKSDQIILKVRTVQNTPYLGPEARKLLPDVRAVAKHGSSWEVRKEGVICMAALAFTDKGTPDKDLLPDFYKRLEDSSAQVRMTTIVALAQFGSSLEKADKPAVVSKIVERESDPDLRVRIAAHVAVMHINQKPSKDHLSAIMNYYADPDPRVRLQVIQGMGATGDDGKKVAPNMVPTLLHMVEDKQMEVSMAALHTLFQLHASETLPDLATLKKSYEKKNPVLSAAIDETIGQMEFVIKNEKEMKEKKDKGDKDKKDKK